MHELLEAAIERLPTETVHQHPPGTAARAAACYAQVVVCEDLAVNGVLGRGDSARAVDLGRPDRPQRDAAAYRDGGLERLGAPGAARPGAATTVRPGGARLD